MIKEHLQNFFEYPLLKGIVLQYKKFRKFNTNRYFVIIAEYVLCIKVILWIIKKFYPFDVFSTFFGIFDTINNISDIIFVIYFGGIFFVASVRYVIIQLNKLNKIDELSTKMINFSGTLNGIEKVVEDVKNKSLELIDKTSSVLAEITGLNIDAKIRKDNEKLVTEGLEAVKFNYMTWSEHINKADKYLQNTWLHYLGTYYREEAFDIQRKELVTNAENYPFLLITTLLSLVETLEKEEYKVYFYSVTPVHPRDWYNWPHGYGVETNCFEQIFMGKYRRILKEILKDKSISKQISHGRFMTTQEKGRAYGWIIGSKSF